MKFSKLLLTQFKIVKQHLEFRRFLNTALVRFELICLHKKKVKVKGVSFRSNIKSGNSNLISISCGFPADCSTSKMTSLYQFKN